MEYPMLQKHNDAKNRWGGVSDIIDHWLEERNELLVKYVALSNPTNTNDDSVSQVQALCEVLMDYVSAGHFEVFERMMEGVEAGENYIKQLYGRIGDTTEIALAFNDKYDNAEHSQEALDDLPRDLSLLGEAIASRIDLEDQMMERLHELH